MFDFFAGQLWFLMVLVLVLWIPGRMGVSVLERKKRFLTLAERGAISVVLSVVFTDFLMIVLGRLGIALDAFPVGTGIALGSAFFWGCARWSALGARSVETHGNASLQHKTHGHASLPKTLGNTSLSTAFLLVFALAVVIKLVYIVPNIVPVSTDLGHHTFWVEKIVQEKKLPEYREQEIEKDANGKNIVGEAKPISDFIEGEHLMLAAVAMLSGKNPVSAFSITTLFFVHLATLLAMYALGRRLFEKFVWRESVGVWTLFFFGVLYALGESQLRYVTGGAVGNVLGNLFIPTAFLLLVLAVRKKRADLLVAAMLVVFGLVYTHHLSTLLCVFSLAGTLIALLIGQRRTLVKNIFPLLHGRATILALLSYIVFFFVVYTPAYIRNMAVTSVVGAPENEEHLGFSFIQLATAVGEPRMVLGLLGLGLLLFFRKTREDESTALLFGWTIPLAFLVLFPDLAHINLPSARVANYLVFPLSIVSAFAFLALFRKLKRFGGLSPRLLGVLAVFAVLAVSYRGFADNDLFMKTRPSQTERALELFSAAKYLSTEIPQDVMVMHDHINIPGDSWIKLFFLRDYNYPFYRALLFRYDRATDKQEKCTLYIFSKPDSAEAKQCQEDLNVRAVLVDEKLDGQQFQHFKNYWKVYSDPFHSVYVRSDS